jgi:6,7-dimethyl-8-ribityllumazine synthase
MASLRMSAQDSKSMAFGVPDDESIEQAIERAGTKAGSTKAQKLR